MSRYLRFFIYSLLFSLLFFPILYIFQIPRYSGEITLYNSHKISSPITINRDEYSIPHIKSSSFKDAIFGLGYAHAQDRLWSMHFNRLFISGRLSEFFGSALLPMDKFVRTIGFNYMADQIEGNLSNIDRAELQSYADGVNEMVNQMTILPLEFITSGFGYTTKDFEPWTIKDSIKIVKFLEFNLIQEWTFKWLYDSLLEYFDESFVEEIMCLKSEYSFRETTVLNDDELKQSNIYSYYNSSNSKKNVNKTIPPKLNRTKFNISENNKKNSLVYQTLLNLLDSPFKGSNNWVIHGNYTKTGKPILANDPHLDNGIPSIWYQAELIYKDNNNQNKQVIGGSMPGIPLILLGKTRDFAWGVTVLRGDDSDLYKESINDEGTHYLSDGIYYPLEIIKENIKIKDQSDVVFDLKFTKHGPLLENFFDINAYFIGEINTKYNYTLSWTGFMRNKTIMPTFKTLYDAKNVSETIDKLKGIPGFYMHMVLASSSDIGYITLGKHMIKNNPEKYGSLNGSDSYDDWVGFIDDNETPYIINPKKGYVATANNKFATDNYIGRTNLHLTSTPRAMRIHQIIDKLIKNNVKIDTEIVKIMQKDVLDPYAEIIVPDLIYITEYFSDYFSTKDQKTINTLLNSLKNWDYKIEKDQIAPSIYLTWEYLFVQKLLKQIDSELIRRKIIFSWQFEQFYLRKISEWAKNLRSGIEANFNEAWCSDSKVSEEFEPFICIYDLITALLETQIYLKKNHGNNWEWGNLHKMLYDHSLFSDSKLKLIANREYPADGSVRTVNVAVEKKLEGSFNAFHSANYRMIINLDQNEKSLYVIDTGVSGNIFSKHYDDQMKMMKNGEYIDMKFSEENMEWEHSLKFI